MSSCHKCLRNYENRFHHASLNWRFALDLLSLLSSDADSTISFGEHWEGLLKRYLPVRLEQLIQKKLQIIEHDGHTIYMDDDRKIIVPWHPFLGGGARLEETLARLDRELNASRVSDLCPLAFANAPISEFQRLRQALGGRR